MPAFAGDRVKVYQMAESGVRVDFPLEHVTLSTLDSSGEIFLQTCKETRANTTTTLNRVWHTIFCHSFS
ncbi:hypothetical protein D1BOALGB6SA_4354 [Olavius sp. associated proteobacterium Delta 1]|nr:hypothetical protein D1BOALGB6SA_4354 [Olavius sp. associated proteobacterium Delta 1]